MSPTREQTRLSQKYDDAKRRGRNFCLSKIGVTHTAFSSSCPSSTARPCVDPLHSSPQPQRAPVAALASSSHFKHSSSENSRASLLAPEAPGQLFAGSRPVDLHSGSPDILSGPGLREAQRPRLGDWHPFEVGGQEGLSLFAHNSGMGPSLVCRVLDPVLPAEIFSKQVASRLESVLLSLCWCYSACADSDDEFGKIASRLAAGIQEDRKKRAARRWEILSFSYIAAWNLRYMRAAWQHVNAASRENTIDRGTTTAVLFSLHSHGSHATARGTRL